MRTINFKKLSFLGFVLMAASALTAAILSPKNDSNRASLAQNGELTKESNGDSTCRTRDGLEVLNCHDSDTAGVFSSTTRDGQLASAGSTPGNTTGQDSN